MSIISIRITSNEESEIKKTAKKNKMTMSELLRKRIFEKKENFQNDNFLLKQKICEIEKNQQEMIQALFEMTKRIRLSANVSISILSKLNPEGYQKELAEIEKVVNTAMENGG